MKHSALLLCLLFVGLFSFVPQAEAMQSWQTVDTGTNAIGSSVDTSARKLFFYNDLWWVFWADGTNMVYKTSADGISWSSKITIRACTNGDKFSWTADTNGYHHYVYTSTSASQDVFYRRGYFEANGSVTWSAPEQTVYDVPAGSETRMVDIAVDTNGCPWVTFCNKTSSIQYPIVSKSSSNDGTWTTASGFPQKLNSTSSTNWWYQWIHVLPDGKMYVLWNRSIGTILYYGKLWNGTAWGPVETVSAIPPMHGMGSMTNIGEDLYFAFQEKASPYRFICVKRAMGVGWGPPMPVMNTGSGSLIPALATDGSTLAMVCPYNGISYALYANGTWSPSVQWLPTGLYGLALQVSEFPAYGRIGAMGNRAITPYYVYFSYFDLASPATDLAGNEIIFTWDHVGYSGQWAVRTSSAFSSTTTGIAGYAPSSWRKLAIVVAADRSYVDFYIDDIWEVRHTINMPNAGMYFCAEGYSDSGDGAGTINHKTLVYQRTTA